ncbi:MAG: hypothetical protein V3R56_00845 [Xanthomonadales bacterium]
MSDYGAHDMVAPLRRVMMKRPGTTMASANPEQWHYAGSLTLKSLQANHAALVDRIQAAGCSVSTFPGDELCLKAEGGMGYASEFHVEKLLREVLITRLAPVSLQLILCYITEKALGPPKSY